MMQDPQAMIQDDDYIAGPPTAPVTVIMYGDFTSEDSKTGYRLILEEFDEADDTICFVYRYLLEKENQDAINCVCAAQAAAKQNRYWEMVDILFEHAECTKKDLYNFANTLGLDILQFEKDFNYADAKEHIERDAKSAQLYGVYSSPGYIINDTILDETPDKETLMDIISSKIQISDLTDAPIIDTAINHAIDYGSDEPEAYELNPMPLASTGYTKDTSDPTDHDLYAPLDPNHGITLTEDEYATSSQNHANPEPS